MLITFVVVDKILATIFFLNRTLLEDKPGAKAHPYKSPDRYDKLGIRKLVGRLNEK